MIFKNFIPIALLFLSIMQSCKQPAYKAPADALFIKILPQQSGINFTNTITDDSSFNEFTYRTHRQNIIDGWTRKRDQQTFQNHKTTLLDRRLSTG